MLTPIQKWYSERSIFITGGTGFMGKVLVEKILRDLPTIRSVYLLIRAKRGRSAEQRWKTITQLPVFDRLHQVNPRALDKVVTVEGNLSEANLGLSDEMKQRLFDQVSIVFHMGASLRLEAGVKDALLANTLGTKYLLDLCTNFKKLDSFTHLSTAFCHCDVDKLEEKLYEPKQNVHEVIKYIQHESDSALERKKKEIIAPHPNSYTFTKRLTEGLLFDYESKFPILVARPSIVIPAIKEPTPGWVDSLNGPIGVTAAAGKGVLRSMLCNRDYNAEVIPVDVAINCLIFLTQCRGIEKRQNALVYNINVPRESLDITWGEIIERSRKINADYPFEWMLWYPDGEMRTNKLIHWLVVILFQWIPAILLDMIFFLVGRERFMIRVQKKILVGLDVLQYFTTRQWDFDTTKLLHAIKYGMSEEDREIFYTTNAQFTIDGFLVHSALGVKKFIFKENLANIPWLKVHYRILFLVHHAIKYYILYLIAWSVLNLFGLSYLLQYKYWLVKA